MLNVLTPIAQATWIFIKPGVRVACGAAVTYVAGYVVIVTAREVYNLGERTVSGFKEAYNKAANAQATTAPQPQTTPAPSGADGAPAVVVPPPAAVNTGNGPDNNGLTQPA